MQAPEATDVDAFIERKKAQWERVAAKQTGLQLIRYGKSRSSFMLVKSTDDFYESVLFGQIPSVKRVAEQKGRRVHHRMARDDEKPVETRAVDLNDAQIDAILEQWGSGQSALGLNFVTCAWGSDGAVITKT